ncbi:unnamed protein product [Darwinula stevensoni]|uniref:sphinganine-1-phosphate aldolase n=1 Tax=Darwinula stevensoni TaxID=69355 RepID=A0A7R9A4R9_9CRUS|nr:unnamed protein product [Darwinula stevensoni]CAG0893097.1 unnamed protein product [Darwinula stevensoni]
METARQWLDPVLRIPDVINEVLGDVHPFRIIVLTCGATILAFYLRNLEITDEPWRRVRAWGLRKLFKLSFIRKYVDREVQKARKELIHGLDQEVAGSPYITHLPSQGLDPNDILQRTELYCKFGKVKYEEGRASGAVYEVDPKQYEIMMKVYARTVKFNNLHRDIFPGCRKMEAEIVRMVCNIFHGGKNSCGVLTSGGTESLILACLAYRNWAREERGISRPEMVVPVSAHAGFDKAASFLNMKIRHVPVDPVTQKVNPQIMKKYINRNTCMLVGSAPGFPHGVMDPIEEIARLGASRGIPVHVDGCLGGFLIAFMEDAGFPFPPFDFRVKGVTSISADTHKYGYCIKGSSTVMYSEPIYLQHQIYVNADWQGGAYATPTLAGSRPGGMTAASWAGLLHMGYDGYVQATRNIISKARYIEANVKKIPGLKTLGPPEVSIVSIMSDTFSIYRFSDGMFQRGWALSNLQSPSAVHLCVTKAHCMEGVADQFLADAAEIAAQLIKDPQQVKEGAGVMYGVSQEIPDRSIVKEFVCSFVEAWYHTKSEDEESDEKEVLTNGAAMNLT